jgi:hypothetical protein
VSEHALTRARHARDELASRLLGDPMISMVDIGQEDADDQPVVRVHVRSGAESLPEIPPEVDGIPVRVVRGDYELEAG